MSWLINLSQFVAVPFKSPRRSVGIFAALALIAIIVPFERSEEPLRPPLEEANYSRLSTSDEISEYLAWLARVYPQARVETFGSTVQGRPLEALVLSGVPKGDVTTSDRLTIEIIGSQHGTEGAGAESLLFIARELLAGTLQHILDDVDVVLVPNANPDGRELGKRVNANGVNLNIDFAALTQPESQALVGALNRYRPEVVLDVHESAVLKRKSLAREGYMTDFSVQFEMANNSNIVPVVRRFAYDEILTPWIAGVDATGLPTHRYIGEVRSSRQPVTNGGLMLKNLRNRTGIEGALSFLMETRLDPKDGVYPTFRNIGERVTMQCISIERFLRVVRDKRAEALAAIAKARRQAATAPLMLDVRYIADPGDPSVPIDLRRIADGELERIEFTDSRTVAGRYPLAMPAAYVVRADQTELAALLDRQGIAYRRLETPQRVRGVEFEADVDAQTAEAFLESVRERSERFRAAPGDLWIDLDQPRGRLAALLLEPRSNNSVFRTPGFFPFAEAGETLPIYRIPRQRGENRAADSPDS